MDPLHANVYSLFEVLARGVLGELKGLQSAGRVGEKEVPHIKIQRPGGLSFPSEHVPDWYLPMWGVLRELEETPEFREFNGALEQDSELGKRMNTMIGTKSQRRRMEPRDFFQILVHRLVYKNPDTLDVDDEQLVTLWNTTVRSLLATKVSVRFWSILENVEIPIGHREILESVYLHGLSDEEVEQLWDNNNLVQEYYPFYGHFHTSILNVQTVIKTEVEEDVVVGDHKVESTSALSNFRRVQISFETILTTLRLFKAEPIVMTPIFEVRKDVFGGTGAYGTRTPLLKPYGSPCKLNDGDLEELDRLLHVVNPAVSRLSRSLAVCLRRIGFANTRMSVEDRLLDIMMALEALVLTDSGKPEDRGELSFRLALRLARFLGKDAGDMQRIFSLAKKAYGLRSKVIHGGQLESGEVGVVKEIEDLTKAATRKYLHTLASNEKVDWTALLFCEDRP